MCQYKGDIASIFIFLLVKVGASLFLSSYCNESCNCSDVYRKSGKVSSIIFNKAEEEACVIGYL